MPGLKNGLTLVYLDLGKILDQPQCFGLGERPPEPLVQMLTRLRGILKEEMTNENGLSGDYLADELSQDADRPFCGQ
jgi:hypothetical protein